MNSRCLQTSCYNPVHYIKNKSTGYCTQHQPPTDYWKMVWSPKTNRPIIPGWDKIRKQILQRDKHTCVNCGAKHANQVDHIIPIWDGGSNLLTNLQTLCDSCHEIKTLKELKTKTQKKRTPKRRGTI